MSIFQIRDGLGYHLSVGAVIYDEEDNILCHRFLNMFGTEEFYILMREALEDNEIIENALERGAMDEFGAKVKIIGFIGGRISEAAHVYDIRKRFEKTTLYFICKLLSQSDKDRVITDIESKSTIVRMKPGLLIEQMKQQFKEHGLNDIDESAIVERAEEIRKNGWQRLSPN